MVPRKVGQAVGVLLCLLVTTCRSDFESQCSNCECKWSGGKKQANCTGESFFFLGIASLIATALHSAQKIQWPIESVLMHTDGLMEIIWNLFPRFGEQAPASGLSLPTSTRTSRSWSSTTTRSPASAGTCSASRCPTYRRSTWGTAALGRSTRTLSATSPSSSRSTWATTTLAGWPERRSPATTGSRRWTCPTTPSPCSSPSSSPLCPTSRR